MYFLSIYYHKSHFLGEKPTMILWFRLKIIGKMSAVHRIQFYHILVIPFYLFEICLWSIKIVVNKLLASGCLHNILNEQDI